ncbi:hypothetical protein [Sporomusa termitida]|nr:hypothetical protein [Sporomusa termitida]
MNVFDLLAKEKDGKNNAEKAPIDNIGNTENYNYEISTDLSASTATDKQQNTLKTTYDLHEDMIFPS